MKVQNNKAWVLLIPVIAAVCLSAILPLITVVNYSVQDIFGPNQRVWVGTEWFVNIIRDKELHGAFLRNLMFSFQVLLIQIPLGVLIALGMPSKGWTASLSLVLVALPLLIPWNVVGTIWQIFARADIGLLGYVLNALGLEFNYTLNARDAWVTVLLMDVWHWTPLIVLLCYAGLQAIPDTYYQAANIDAANRWAIFRYIELPRLRGVLLIGLLLRFMDSFMIYTEPFVVTGGGPGTSTTFLSIFLSKIAVGQFDLGRAAAFSLIYFLFIQFFCYILFTVLNAQEDHA